MESCRARVEDRLEGSAGMRYKNTQAPSELIRIDAAAPAPALARFSPERSFSVLP